MAEYRVEKAGLGFTIDTKYYNNLDLEGFSHMMKDPSYCYKFYWLEAIVQLIAEGVTETTFDVVIDEMICNARYSVREFHIHLSGVQLDGQVRDGLERAVRGITCILFGLLNTIGKEVSAYEKTIIIPTISVLIALVCTCCGADADRMEAIQK